MVLALKKLEKSYLEMYYAQSEKETGENPILKEEVILWEKTSADGIDAENW